MNNTNTLKSGWPQEKKTLPVDQTGHIPAAIVSLSFWFLNTAWCVLQQKRDNHNKIALYTLQSERCQVLNQLMFQNS